MALIYAVEDDKNILEIEMFALKNSGYQVDGFECARDFYKKLDERQPDLVLLDIMLPDEDGLEIVGKLRRRPETKKLPVIMVTAKTTEIDKVKGLDVGADDYLTKPFGVMELIARVKAVLRRTMGGGEVFKPGRRVPGRRKAYGLCKGPAMQPDVQGIRALKAAAPQCRDRGDPGDHPGTGLGHRL